MSHWSISVKTVGQSDVPSHDFIIRVQPDDDLSSMYEQIEEFTGLKASQQRLIYRGRIIRNDGNDGDSIKHEPKVKDVVGLTDGQTIHLVPRPEPAVEALVEASDSRVRSLTEPAVTSISLPTRARLSDADSSMQSGTSTASLLAALLGIEVVDDDNANDGNMSLGQQLARLRSARVRHRNRRPCHRLTHSDLEVEDPGSMEPVRQGLMTLHSLLEGDQENAPRQFYRGQWIDCRDTVNQWLEATVVQIVRPDDILPVHLLMGARAGVPRRSFPTTDPPVGANDYDGRLRLLVEPIDGEPVDREWGGYQQRSNNDGVVILLVHYNGWPHRWDEWIRSDSERIRPFRTRTRHPSSSTTACPTPEALFNASPMTNIKSADDSMDRAALLPELQRVFSVVNNHIERITQKEISSEPEPESDGYLPWISVGNREAQSLSILVDDIDEPFSEDENSPVHQSHKSSKSLKSKDFADEQSAQSMKTRLQALIPLLDRLGRTLVDAAPHLAAYAATLPDTTLPEPERTPRGESNVVVAEDDEEPHARSIGTLMSLMPSGDRRVSESRAVSPEPLPVDEYETIFQPDYADFRNASVNIVRSDARNRSGGRSNSDDAGLLGAYLAAASLSSMASDDDGEGSSVGGLAGLGRLIRQRETGGTGGGGIDIHIHAIVTGPMGGATGMALLGETQIATPRPSLFSSSSRRPGVTEPRIPLSPPMDEDELGIFSDLYSETPSPVDLPNGQFPSDANIASFGMAINQMDEIVTFRETPERPLSFRLARQRASTPRNRLSPTPSARRTGRITRLFRRLSSRRSNSNHSFHGLS